MQTRELFWIAAAARVIQSLPAGRYRAMNWVAAHSSAESVILAVAAFGYRAWLIDHSPAAHRQAAAGRLTAASLLSPVAGGDSLGRWPHVLFARQGLGPLSTGEPMVD